MNCKNSLGSPWEQRGFCYSSQAAYTHLTGKLGPKEPQTVPHSDAASLLFPTENELTFPTGDIFSVPAAHNMKKNASPS